MEATLRRTAAAQCRMVADAVRGVVLRDARLADHAAWLAAVYLAADGEFAAAVVDTVQAAAQRRV